MFITQETDNALRVLVYLASLEQGERCSTRLIAQHMTISMQFTLKILNKLTRSGLTRAYRGVKGGYSLNLHPSEISLKDVIEITDGPVHLFRCLLDPNLCNRGAADVCKVHAALSGVQEELTANLDSIKLSTLI